ncbi:head GIN domain-containing protein [Massilia jejuensis]|uniref:Head GIN domain-containing protein n=1 Tax=Massilia jejuensis TaxID=648894 RepID=A0ABW0PIS7_9BURK
MRSLFRVGLGLLLLACVLIGLFYGMLRAQGGAARMDARIVGEETRPLTRQARAVELRGPIDLTLRYGAQPALVVRGEQRLLANIDTVQEGRVLHIGTRGIVLRHRQPIEVELTLPGLERVAVDGSGDTRVNGFSGEAIEVELNGSGSLDFNGRYRQAKATVHGSGDLTLDAGNSDSVDAALTGSGTITLAGAARSFQAASNGSGTLDAQRLRAENVKVRQTGSGNASVTANAAIAAAVSGSGDIDVHGNPSRRSVSRTGSGEVHFDH